ncbi:hypothetical protein ACIQMY_24805 [Streptomyces sp. NPDC091368]|uniref:hypothetical protein n=1 Tax=Streptomyces sp. NPDC091368 TaxID=3365993 RepID=UPI00380B9F94
MNRSRSRSTLSSRPRGHVVGLLAAGMIALAGQGSAFAAEQPAESRTAVTTAEHGTVAGRVSAPGFDPLAWLERIGALLPDVVTLPKNNNDWQ